MTRLGIFIAISLLMSLPAATLAETPLTPEQFEARVQGRTLTYGVGNLPYGAEEYLSGRRVRWSFLDGECKEGYWYPEDTGICFIYEDTSTPQCWHFFSGDNGLIARFLNDPEADDLYQVHQSDGYLACPGPEVGV